MKILRTLCLLFSVGVLFVSCTAKLHCAEAVSGSQPEIAPLINLTDQQPELYSSSFEVFDYKFSGLIAFRRMGMDSTVRIAFISEMGLKLMEFEFRDDNVTNSYCMPAIKKRSTIRFVEKFLYLLLHQPPQEKCCKETLAKQPCTACRSFREKITVCTNESLTEKTVIRGRKQEAFANYTINKSLPDSISVLMRFNTQIKMKHLNNAFE